MTVLVAEAVGCPIEPDADVPFKPEGPAATFDEEGEAFDAEAEVFNADAVVLEPGPERLKLGRARRRAVWRAEEAKRGASLAVSLRSADEEARGRLQRLVGSSLLVLIS